MVAIHVELPIFSSPTEPYGWFSGVLHLQAMPECAGRSEQLQSRSSVHSLIRCDGVAMAAHRHEITAQMQQGPVTRALH